MTAYKMLSTFIDLKPGEWIVQNGGNSSVSARSVRSVSTCDLNRELDEIGGPSGYPVGQRSWDPYHQPCSQKVSVVAVRRIERLQMTVIQR